MNREDLIYMVQEVIFAHSNVNPFDFAIKSIDQLERFAELVAAHEREECAKVCESQAWDGPCAADDIADAIRARGEK